LGLLLEGFFSTEIEDIQSFQGVNKSPRLKTSYDIMANQPFEDVFFLINMEIFQPVRLVVVGKNHFNIYTVYTTHP